METFIQNCGVNLKGDLPTVKRFTCDLCGFKFSKEKFLTNHYNFCKEVDNPGDRLGARTDANGNDQSGDAHQSDETAPIKPIIHVTLDFTEGAESDFGTETSKSTPSSSIQQEEGTPRKRGRPKKNGAVKCNFCNFSTASKYYAEAHKKIHLDQKPYKCDKCDYATARKYNAKRHMEAHSGRKYKCDYCTFASAYSSYLKQHRRLHTGEKPFKCTTCDYRTAFRKCLTTHVQTHLDEKPHRCSECSFATFYAGSLKHHMLGHAMEIKGFGTKQMRSVNTVKSH